ncbi:leucine-rich repeat-containing protein 74B-like isoform X1 [Stylophora pistillata]|uniref:leucine-rich repeat-containing protein 74B-like isoform X1 n=1 Tax=Stylophora pistillata TaxID=50429 RepID=UPI000C051BFC|nr:leucine-rich repeat-containing protein 74B-like isoform X1 [Stylophora pistillata]
MSAAGLRAISESPTDSLKDSDQFSIKGDVLTEENEDVEAVEASEGNSGFFIKHGTFMGTEREQMDSQASDMASCDSDYDTDLETEEKSEKFDATGWKIYLAACKFLDITPVSFFLRNIQEKQLNFRHRLLGAKGGQALAAALELNTTLASLDLHENFLEGEGGAAIAAMLKENCYITELDVSSNKLGSYGCMSMCDMLQNNVSLLKIDLSDNGFSDKDTVYLLDAFKGNDKVTWMNLSHNKFSEKSGENLGLGISFNDAMEYLDLSWNHIRRKGATEITKGLRTNCTLNTLNLSYNGFSNDGAVALGEAIRANNTLIELNISHNRITTQGALCIAKGLEGNNTVEILKICGNPIGVPGAMAIISAAKNYSDSALTELHFKDIYLDEEFDLLLAEVREVKPDFRIIANLRSGAKDPLSVVRTFVSNNQDQWLEICQQFDSDGTFGITRTDFVKCLRKAGIEFGIEQTAGLLTQLDPMKTSFINYTFRPTFKNQIPQTVGNVFLRDGCCP